MIFSRGYSAWELEDVQSRYGLAFPPDLLEFFSRRRRVTDKGYDWTHDHAAVVSALKWPLEGLLFDLREDDLWLETWGERPDAAADRERRLVGLVDEAPKLIPLCGHRYLSEMPRASGNPVMSVYQSDIIYYAPNLTDFSKHRGAYLALKDRPARIDFWSDLIDAN